MYLSLSIHRIPPSPFYFFFFFNDTATTEIYTLSLHDALPIYRDGKNRVCVSGTGFAIPRHGERVGDRKSTRLNSSHLVISYAVFCLKKKKKECSNELQDVRIIDMQVKQNAPSE